MAKKEKTTAGSPNIKGKAKKTKKKPEVQYHRQPGDMDADNWQTALRRQFAANNRFVVKKMTGEIVLADYIVTNPENNNAYKVALRSAELLRREHGIAKVLIFSQWARMNNLVAEMLQELDVDYRYLHGMCPPNNAATSTTILTTTPRCAFS